MARGEETGGERQGEGRRGNESGGKVDEKDVNDTRSEEQTRSYKELTSSEEC